MTKRRALSSRMIQGRPEHTTRRDFIVGMCVALAIFLVHVLMAAIG